MGKELMRRCGAALLCMASLPALAALPWDLSSPDRRIELPAELQEISGIASAGPDRLACVQDEEGSIFILELSTSGIIARHPFGAGGDWEDLALSDTAAWVLRSDGMVFRVAQWNSARPSVDFFRSGIPAADAESLCLLDGRVLMAPKSNLKASGASRKDRTVWSVYLPPDGSMPGAGAAEIILSVDLDAATAFLAGGGTSPKTKKKSARKKVPAISFRTSALTADGEGRLYLLSAYDPFLIALDKTGAILAVERLDPLIFPKAEGLAILEDGSLAVANEGGSQKASILIFQPSGNP